MVKVLACSVRVIEKGMGPPLRGLVHSAFASATNIIFPDRSLLSLNASPPHPTPQGNYYHRNDRMRAENFSNFLPAFDHFDDERKDYLDHAMAIKNFPNFLSPLHDPNEKEKVGLVLNEKKRAGVLMPNGILLDASAGEFPFAELRAGMPVIWGAGRLVLDAVACVLDFADCPRWNPQIERPADLNMELVRANGLWLAQFCRREDLSDMLDFEGLANEAMPALAARLCGRGRGLTPSGDDFLAGWMAAGWLLTGPQPDFLASCQQICQIARRRTHALSQCWLEYAAAGDVARPVSEVLTALTKPDRGELERAARGLLALGATSGCDLLQGMLYYPLIREIREN